MLYVFHVMYLHVCCTGKLGVIKYIFNEATVHSNSNLLRSISGRQSSLSVLYDALIMLDSFHGNTPLHLCCEALTKCSHIGPSNEHFCCINSLLDFIEDRHQRVEQCKKSSTTI